MRVQSQPAGLTCSAGNGVGTMPTHAVTDVSIVCSDQAYSLGGTVAGLGAMLIQGYYCARPMDASAIDAYLENERAALAAQTAA